MIRKVGTGFPSRQTRSVCAEIMLDRKVQRAEAATFIGIAATPPAWVPRAGFER
jgi:hypothetical protein